MGNILYATLLGKFSLAWPDKDGPGVIRQDESMSPQLWTFLGYLCVNHRQPMREEDVIRVVLGEGRVIDAAGAMKSLRAQVRTLLEGLGFPNGANVLLHRHDTYAWAPGLEFSLDTEDLDALERRFVMEPEETLSEVLDFLPRFQDGFLPVAVKSEWTSTMQRTCRDRYLRVVRGAADLLGKAGRYDEAIRLCRAAVDMAPMDEWSQLHLMQFLHASGATQSALWHYRFVSRLYMDLRGTEPPEQLTVCYQELSEAARGEVVSLEAIRRHLATRDNLARPLYCKYPVFQAIYHLTARSLERNGSVAQLVMLTVEARDGSQLTAQRCGEAMEALRTKGLSGLREGDVCTRFGPNQYLLLLPATAAENVGMTLARCLSAFERTPEGQGIAVQISVQPVQPIET